MNIGRNQVNIRMHNAVALAISYPSNISIEVPTEKGYRLVSDVMSLRIVYPDGVDSDCRKNISFGLNAPGIQPICGNYVNKTFVSSGCNTTFNNDSAQCDCMNG